MTHKLPSNESLNPTQEDPMNELEREEVQTDSQEKPTIDNKTVLLIFTAEDGGDIGSGGL